MSSLNASILVFDTNKRFLLYKLLTRSLERYLRKEILANFGHDYVHEKFVQYASLDSGSGVAETDLLNQSLGGGSQSRLEIPDDVIYEYFAPLVNSYAISKDIDYSFEYVLFDQNRYIIRFQNYKNCLIMCLYDLAAFGALMGAAVSSSELANSIYTEFYTAWACKSMIGLMKYKFGICSDDRCFRKSPVAVHVDLGALFVRWSQYNANDLVYYLEVNESLDVNEEIRKKCDEFLAELVESVLRKDRMMQEFDDMDESYESHGSETTASLSLATGSVEDDSQEPDTEGAGGDQDEEEAGSEANFAFDESLSMRSRQRRRSLNDARYLGLENFLKDAHLLGQYVLSYGCKLLYKYRSFKATGGGGGSQRASGLLANSNGNLKNLAGSRASEESGSSTLQIDSSSLFMLLLEAASFIDYECQSPFLDDDSDAFKSASSTPEPASVVNEAPTFTVDEVKATTAPTTDDSSPEDFRDLIDESTARSPRPGTLDIRLASSVAPSVSSFYEETFQSVKSASTPMFFPNGDRMRSESSVKDSPPVRAASDLLSASGSEYNRNVIKFKLTSCFLQHTNKSLAFYDVLYLRLTGNLCLTMLKLNRLSRHCEVMADMEAQLADFHELVMHKSLQLSQDETRSSLKTRSDEETSQGPRLTHSQSVTSMSSTAAATMEGRSSTSSKQAAAKEQERRFEKQFFSLFFDKVRTFIEKLETLRRELKSEKDSKAARAKADLAKSDGDPSDSAAKTANGRTRRAPLTRSYRINSTSTISESDSGRASWLPPSREREEAMKNSAVKLIGTLKLKLDFLRNSNNFNVLGKYINNGSVSVPATGANSGGGDTEPKSRLLTNDELLNSFQKLEKELELIRTNLGELFYELFVAQSATQTDEIICDPAAVASLNSLTKKRSSTTSTLTGVSVDASLKPATVVKKKFPFRFKSSQEKKNSLTSFISQLASASSSANTPLAAPPIESRASSFIESLRALYEKHINDYVVFMDVKLRRNVAMSFYWHRFRGLVHFSFINRQDNSCIVPTTEASLEYGQNEFKINQAYRKYMPVVWTLLCRYDCTHVQFVDEKLHLVFSYYVWFEDRNANYIPADMNHYEPTSSSLSSGTTGGGGGGGSGGGGKTSVNAFLASKAHLRQLYMPGIADRSYYDFLKAACYPNAPPDSLICYELICLHAERIDQDTIREHTNILISTLSKMKS